MYNPNMSKYTFFFLVTVGQYLIKITKIRDNVRILEGTVQKQMIHLNVLLQTKKMLFCSCDIKQLQVSKIQFASIISNGQQRLHAFPTDWAFIMHSP